MSELTAEATQGVSVPSLAPLPPQPGGELSPTSPRIGGRGAETLGLYVHIPFCARKCPYCDFNTYAGLDDLHGSYTQALVAEIRTWGERLHYPTLKTIFVGGGTPTILSAAQLADIFTAIHDNFALAPGCEITCEANPGTVDQARFADLRRLGVNRLSMGVQSFQGDELAFLGRIHDVADVYRAFAAARRAGFDNINLDFIFGLPHQPMEAWQETLQRAVALGTEHLSLYSLIVEPETPLHHWVQTGKVDGPDADLAADQYELAMQVLGTAGYGHYEVSNWAKGDHECQHNLVYWRNQEYVGVGPGAHSHLKDLRWGNRRPVPGYIKRVGQGRSVEAFQETISPRLAMGETMMLGLRLIEEGVTHARFQNLHGASLAQVFAAEVAQLQGWGMLDVDEERVRLTQRGLMLGNQIFARFLPD
ncbi:MAG: radical SAM family heme chaperone HemW [Caldilineaceae bacterium]|nr:radical SAM family heme chaperone HemW [Caldilineaceae bacterium]MBP8106068.1 radical SAM family heme chaperone HemW [Caldilineaceae bacterium]MBP8121926.1 radical SAM family heme chaperone HemW [Caldilineaceae bacterium]MBP9073356.1 radical SAM family heme chaperone HemW [Caldilineaceae bacterium]